VIFLFLESTTNLFILKVWFDLKHYVTVWDVYLIHRLVIRFVIVGFD
jgi:hypothetical protein